MGKWVLPGAGGLIAAAVIVGVVLMMGGSDSSKKDESTAVVAKSVLAPAKVESSSEDLAATIASLNKAQLQVASLTSSSKPVAPKDLDRALADVAANSMRVAELSNVLSQTAVAQGTDAPTLSTASAISQNYDSIAQTGYAQAIDAQNLRNQLSAGTLSLPSVTQTIAAYGAQMWNNSVTIVGVDGNPFVPFMPGGVSPVQISITLAPVAVQQIIVQFGPSPSGWVAASSTYVSWPIYVNLAPVRQFDPFDQTLLRQMLTLEGQLDPLFSQRYALARLQQFRRQGNADRIGMFSLTGVTDLVNDRAAKGTYVNMYDLPTSGQLGLNMLLPNGIAVANTAQIQAGVVPSYPNGTVFAYSKSPGAAGTGGAPVSGASAGGPTALFAKSGADGAPSGAVSKLFMEKSVAQASITMTSVDPGPLEGYKETKTGEVGYGRMKITVRVTWFVPGSVEKNWSVQCGAEHHFFNERTGSHTFVLDEYVKPPSVTIECWVLTPLGGLASTSRSVDVGSDDFRDAIKSGIREEEAKAKKKDEDRKKDIEQLGELFPVAPTGIGTGTSTVTDPVAVVPTPPENQVTTNTGGTDQAAIDAKKAADAKAAADKAAADKAAADKAAADRAAANKAAADKAAADKAAADKAAADKAAADKAAADKAAADKAAADAAAANQNRANCFTIYDSGKFLSNTEKSWFTANCSAKSPLNCTTLVGNLNQFEQGLKNSLNCNTAPPGPNCSPQSAFNGGSVAATAASGTSSPLTAGCKYTVCLTGTISAKNKAGAPVSLSPGQATMKADGALMGGNCVTKVGTGKGVVFTCDGGLFDGDPYSNPGGAFGITLAVLGPA
jgi:hypothetical protein